MTARYRSPTRSPSAPPGPLVLQVIDLGTSDQVNCQIFNVFYQGIATSAALLPNGSAVVQAVTRWNELELRRRHGAMPSECLRRRLRDPASPFDLGIQLTLSQGRPICANFPDEGRDAAGNFSGVGALLTHPCGAARRGLRDAVRSELISQIELLFDLGAPVTCLCPLQTFDQVPSVTQLLPDLCDRFRLPAVLPIPGLKLFQPEAVAASAPAATCRPGWDFDQGMASQPRALDWLISAETASQLYNRGFRLGRHQMGNWMPISRCRVAA